MSIQPETVIRHMALKMVAIKHCLETGKEEWLVRHTASLKSLVKEFLPSGSGWDKGTRIRIDSSEPDRIMLFGDFHHMDEVGCYIGWTHHALAITPSLASGFDIAIDGFTRETDDAAEYIHGCFDHSLRTMVRETEDGWILDEN